MRTGPLEDSAVAERILAGEEAAFASLVNRYHNSLLRLALAFVPDRASAEEVVQDTWLAVFNGLRGFKGRSTLKTWLFRILTNQAKTKGVREKRSVPFSSLTASQAEEDAAVDPARFTASGMWADPPHAWNDDTPEKLLLRQESRAFLERAIAELPPNQRAVVTLRDVEGLEAEEVCNILEITDSNQRVLLHRARSKLRSTLEQYLGGK